MLKSNGIKYVFWLLVLYMTASTLALVIVTTIGMKQPDAFTRIKTFCEEKGGEYSQFRLPEDFGVMCTFPNSKLPEGQI